MKTKLHFLFALALPVLAMGQITEVVTVNPTGDGNPDRIFVNSNNEIFFRGNSGNGELDTHVWNGSSLNSFNTRVGSNDNPNYFIELDGYVYFQSYFNDGTTNYGNELHRSNGSSFERVTSFPGTAAGTTNQDNFITANGKLYLVMNGGDNSVQIWMYDPNLPTSDANPKKVENPSDPGFSQPNNLSAGILNGTETILLKGRWGSNALYLLTLDPITNTYQRMEDSNGVAPLAALSLAKRNYLLASNGNFYFEGDGTNGDDELWVTNGTPAGTKQLSDINPNGDSNPQYITEFQGAIYFSAENGNSEQLYVYNGTTVNLAATINPSGDALIKDLFSDGNYLYFSATNGVNGVELWKYDGTVATMVKDINSAGDALPSDFVSLGGNLFFSADDGTGSKLWLTDGTSEGTVTVASQFSTSEDPVDVKEIKLWDNKLVFSARGINGVQLFSFDPTTLSVDSKDFSLLKIYPNPTSDYLMFSNEFLGSSYAIYDVMGKRIQNGILDSEKLNLRLNAGVYMINLENGTSQWTKKIIIK